jgi:hypothetical protein
LGWHRRGRDMLLATRDGLTSRLIGIRGRPSPPSQVATELVRGAWLLTSSGPVTRLLSTSRAKDSYRAGWKFAVWPLSDGSRQQHEVDDEAPPSKPTMRRPVVINCVT